jgi:hypothetical protein
MYGTSDHPSTSRLSWALWRHRFWLIVYFVGQYMMHTMFRMQLVFGAFFIHTGIMTAFAS